MVSLVAAFWAGRQILSTRQLDLSTEINPHKKYTLVLWDFDRPLGSDYSYKEELDKEIREFNKAYPNIAVKLELFSWDEKEEVAATIKKREGLPDVLATGPLVDLSFARDLFLSAEHLTIEEQANYVSLAWNDGIKDNDIAIWPRYLAPQLYLANEKLLQAAGVTGQQLKNEGLTWDALLSVGDVLSQLPSQPFVLVSFNYQGLLAAVASLGQVDDMPNLVAEAEIAGAIRLKQLQEKGYLPSPLSEESYSGIQDFFTGRAALLAPAEPWLLRTVIERSERVQRGLLEPGDATPFPVTLVAPKFLPDLNLPVRVEGLVVQRRRAADETRAAVELARHLSKSGSLAAKLDLLPAWRPAQDAWSKAWSWGNEATLLSVLEYPWDMESDLHDK